MHICILCIHHTRYIYKSSSNNNSNYRANAVCACVSARSLIFVHSICFLVLLLLFHLLNFESTRVYRVYHLLTLYTSSWRKMEELQQANDTKRRRIKKTFIRNDLRSFMICYECTMLLLLLCLRLFFLRLQVQRAHLLCSLLSTSRCVVCARARVCAFSCAHQFFFYPWLPACLCFSLILIFRLLILTHTERERICTLK